MGEGTCQFRFSPKEIKYFSERQGNFLFSNFFVFTFVFNSYYA